MPRNILIVDDDAVILKIMSDFLVKEGYGVFTAESGEDALRLTSSNDFQVIFIDLLMPKMTGYDLCKKIREKNKDAWICALTGLGSVFRNEECMEAGFDAYYIKPFNIKLMLKDLLRNVFDKMDKKSNDVCDVG